MLRSALNSSGFAESHHRIGNLAVLTQGPAYSDGMPVTPAWEKIVALMDRSFGPVLRGSRPATSLTKLAPALDGAFRASTPDRVTSAFDDARYGGRLAPDAEVRRLREEWERLRSE